VIEESGQVSASPPVVVPEPVPESVVPEPQPQSRVGPRPRHPQSPLVLPPGRSVRWVESYKQDRGSGRGRVGGCRKATGPGDAGVAEGEHRARERAWLGRRIV
jgi:hypothetical protein